MALLRAQTRAGKGRSTAGSLMAKYIFVLLAIGFTMSPVIVRKIWSPKFEDDPGGFDDGEEEAAGGLDSIPADSSGGQTSIDDELLQLDQQLQAMEAQRMALEEAERAASASVRGSNSSVPTSGNATSAEVDPLTTEATSSQAAKAGEARGHKKLPHIKSEQDVRHAWETVVNEAMASLDVCEDACASCALSIAVANNKIDAELLASGEPTVVGSIKTQAEWDLKLGAMQRDIVRCTSRFDQNREERLLRKRMTDVKIKQFEDSMRDVNRREKQAAKYELLRQELLANMEREQEEEKHLHDIANPIWYDMNRLRDTALTVCTEKVNQIMLTKHHRTELYTPAVLKETQVLVRSCVRDFSVSRGKAKLSAEKLQNSVERRKNADFEASAATPKHILQLQRIAGIEADAMDEILDVKKDAMHTTFADLRKAMRENNRPSDSGEGRRKGKQGAKKTKHTIASPASGARLER